jgi:uncharacterized protein YkwD
LYYSFLTGFIFHPSMKITSRFLLVILVCTGWLVSHPEKLAAVPVNNLLATSPADNAVLERGILVEMNKARANPQVYIKTLTAWRQRFRGRRARLAPHLFLETKEGIEAVDEAIESLKKTAPAPQLKLSKGLTAAARDHVVYQGKLGLVGHSGKNRSTPFERMNRYGRWRRAAGENISYGASSPVAVVRDLIVDDGVPDRSHRVNMFRKDYRITGVSCGLHKTYRIMCVIAYAAAYQER